MDMKLLIDFIFKFILAESKMYRCREWPISVKQVTFVSKGDTFTV